MKKFIKKISQVVQAVLLAPIKLPGKMLAVLKYVAISLGIIDQILDDNPSEETTDSTIKEDDENA